jgi:beta-1,4-N-acetylglucosaminyltransferase
MPHPGPRYPIHYLGPTRKKPGRFITDTARFMLSFVEAYRLVSRLRPHAVLALGTSTAIPLFFAAKCLLIPSIFIESLTRVEQMSVTGRILYHLNLADRLYVQWPKLKETFQGTTFAGAVL